MGWSRSFFCACWPSCWCSNNGYPTNRTSLTFTSNRLPHRPDFTARIFDRTLSEKLEHTCTHTCTITVNYSYWHVHVCGCTFHLWTNRQYKKYFNWCSRHLNFKSHTSKSGYPGFRYWHLLSRITLSKHIKGILYYPVASMIATLDVLMEVSRPAPCSFVTVFCFKTLLVK